MATGDKPFDQDDHFEGMKQSLSWRDVYRAVGDSEDRITAVIKDSLAPLVSATNDHEVRIRTIEIGGSPSLHAQAILMAAIDARVKLVENEFANLASRENGILATLTVGQKFVLLVAAIVGLFWTATEIISKLAL